MFTMQEQRTWLKIQCARGHTAHNVMKVLWMARPGHPSVSEEDVEAVSALLDTDRRLTVHDLALEIGLSHMTVFRIVRKHLGM